MCVFNIFCLFIRMYQGKPLLSPSEILSAHITASVIQWQRSNDCA